MTASKSNKSLPRVYSLSRASRCYGCDAKLASGALIKLRDDKDEREVLCQQCAGLSDYQVLPAGNAKLTRKAAKESENCFAIMKWSELWKCYERQGLLIEKSTLERLQKE
jgi:hypothetical protein